MSGLSRLSLSLDDALCGKLDEMMAIAGSRNRSEFVREMIRARIVDDCWQNSASEVLGTITLLYDHHQRELCGKLTEIQHDSHVRILAATHVHLNHELCAEMIMVVGSVAEVNTLYLELKKPRGMLHAALSMSSTGDDLK